MSDEDRHEMGAPAEQALERRAAEQKSRRAGRSGGGALGPMGVFFREFLRHPVMVGSIIPSSGRLIRNMLARTDWANTKLFVEYGPGVGTFCQPVLDRLGPDASYIAIDTNREFVDYLAARIRDPRFAAVHGSAADIGRIIADRGHAHADYILSGLPFSTLPPGVGATIAQETAAAIRPGGAFLVYQFNPRVKDFLTPHFPRIDHLFEPINIPPAQLWWAWKE